MNIHKNLNIARRTPSRSNQSRSFEERRKRRIIFGAIAMISATASWMFVLYKVSSLPALALTDVQIQGVEADAVQNLRAAVYRSIQGSYLGIFSKANTLLYPEGAIVAAVGAASPRIQKVAVRRDGLHGLTVAITEKNPIAVACASLPNFDDAGTLIRETSRDRDDCYFTDETGLIFKKILEAVPDTYNYYYVPAVSDHPVGKYATSTKTFLAVQKFVDGVRASGITPQAVLLKAGGEYELYVKNSGGSTAIVYFNETGSFPTELMNLSAFWNSMQGNFEYIDVRSGSNVFYRLIQ